MENKIKHVQLNKFDLPHAIRNTETYRGFEKFKQGLTLRPQSINRLHDYYMQACRYGIEYLKQNPNLFANDIKIINEIINT